MEQDKPCALTEIIVKWQHGDKQAESELYQFTYLKLRELAQNARQKSGQKFGFSNQVLSDSINNTTALIHDAYLRMSTMDRHSIASTREFLLMAAKVMQQILIDHARSAQAQKRQHNTPSYDLHDNKIDALLSVNQVLEHFSDHYPRQSDAFKLKYLIGMKNQEISQLLECSCSLIEKDLKFSRSWLASKVAN